MYVSLSFAPLITSRHRKFLDMFSYRISNSSGQQYSCHSVTIRRSAQHDGLVISFEAVYEKRELFRGQELTAVALPGYRSSVSDRGECEANCRAPAVGPLENCQSSAPWPGEGRLSEQIRLFIANVRARQTNARKRQLRPPGTHEKDVRIVHACIINTQYSGAQVLLFCFIFISRFHHA